MKAIWLSSVMISGVFLSFSCKKGEETTEVQEQPVKVGRVVETTPKTEVAVALSEYTMVFQDGEYKKTNLRDAEKYILYYSASW